jgi:DNA repair protein RadC
MEVQLVKIHMVRERTIQYGGPIYNAGGCYEAIKGIFDGEDREMFIVVCLRRGNHINAINIVSIDTMNHSLAHPSEVFKPAILSNSASIIVAHNHPGGDLAHSGDDKAITKQLIEAGQILGIELLDHLVIGEDHYHSMADNNEMGRF